MTSFESAFRPERWNFLSFFFFNDTATTEIYTLSLHHALPNSLPTHLVIPPARRARPPPAARAACMPALHRRRSEEHTSELQSLRHLVCRLLLEKKKKTRKRSN